MHSEDPLHHLPARTRQKLRDHLPDRMHGGKFTAIGWIAPPDGISEKDLLELFTAVGDWESNRTWYLGDMYLAFSEEAKQRFLESWEGPPSIHTVQNAASLAKAFPRSRRRERPVSPKHHAELIGLSEREQDALLDWCEGTRDPTTGRHPSVEDLREKKRCRAMAPPCLEAPKAEIEIEAEVCGPEVEPVEDPATPDTEAVREPVAEPLSYPAWFPPEQTADLRPWVGFHMEEDLHARAEDIAAEDGMTLTAWIIAGIIERIKEHTP